MYRIILVACFSLIFIAQSGIAEDELSSEANLKLQCYIAFANFNSVKDAAIAADVILSNLKHNDGGTVLVGETDNYRFWVMTHSLQTLDAITFINNFQVAIEHKFVNLFVHALSDSTYTPGATPKRARVSLVDYQPDSFLENGELIFECTS